MIRKDFSKFKYRRFNPSVNEWLNSVYYFDRNKLNTLWSNKIIFELINSYFNIKPNNVTLLNKVEENDQPIDHPPLKRIFVSLPEIKNSLGSNNIFIYVFNKEKIIFNKKLTKLHKIYRKTLYRKAHKRILYNNRFYGYLNKKSSLKRVQRMQKEILYINSIKNSRLFNLKKIPKIFEKEFYTNLIKNIRLFNLGEKKNINENYVFFINNGELFNLDKIPKVFKKFYKNFTKNIRLFNLGKIQKMNKNYLNLINKNLFDLKKIRIIFKKISLGKTRNFNILPYNKVNILNNKLVNLNILNFFKICINRLKSFNFKINKEIIKSIHAKIYIKLFKIEEKKISNFILYKRNFKNNLIQDINMEQDFTKVHEIMTKKYYILFFYKRYITRLYFNNLKFNYINLLNLNKIIYKLYNKHVNINIINLKYLHLDNSLFINAIVRKLKKRQSKVLRVLRKALALAKIPSIDPVFLLRKDLLPQIPKKEIELTDYLFNFKYLKLKNINKVIFESLKNIHLIGARLEGKGRLTRRLTASRAVYKKAYKGNLKNVYSSFKKLSAVMSRGFNKSNVNYINKNSYRRTGSYGIKSWHNTM